MAHPLTLAGSAAPSIIVPDDGDDLEAASVETPFISVGNWLQWIHDRLTGVTPIVANISIQGWLDVRDQITIGGFGSSAIEALGDINTQGAIYAQNGALFDGPVECQAGIVTGPLFGVFAGTGGVLTTGDVACSDVLPTGVVRTPTIFGSDADPGLIPGRTYIAAPTALRVWTLPTVGLSPNDWIEVAVRATITNFRIQLGTFWGAGTTYDIQNDGAGGHYRRVKAIWDGTMWHAIAT